MAKNVPINLLKSACRFPWTPTLLSLGFNVAKKLGSAGHPNNHVEGEVYSFFDDTFVTKSVASRSLDPQIELKILSKFKNQYNFRSCTGLKLWSVYVKSHACHAHFDLVHRYNTLRQSCSRWNKIKIGAQ